MKSVAREATKSKKKGSSKSTSTSAGGFGAGSSASASSAKKVKRKTGTKAALAFKFDKGPGIENYLHPRLFEEKGQDDDNNASPESTILDDIKVKLRAGEIVVIRNAFDDNFAQAMHEELLDCEAWTKNEDYFADGYHYKHDNVYDQADFSPLFLKANDMFASDETRQFMTTLTGRDCSGETVGAPSHYAPGDHSLPHTDHIGQRTVAYIWHLSQSWRPEWGGGLFWAPEPLANAYLHASFNTLVLFSVTPFSSHFVTTVSPHATEERLAYNGWWHSSWVPVASKGEEILERLNTPEKRLALSHAQILALSQILDDPWAPKIQPPETHDAIVELRQTIMTELYPPPRSSPY